MKMKSLLFAVFLVLTILFIYPACATQEAAPSLHFVTAQDNSTTNDRLLYHLYQQIEHNIYFESLLLKTACETANNGDADGVASVTVDVLGNYPNLVIIPETLSYTDYEVYAMKGAGYQITGWGDLSGYRVGAIMQKMYLSGHLPKDIAGFKEYATLAELSQALVDGKIDVLVTTRGIRQFLELPDSVEYIATIDTIATYNALNKAHADLIPALTKALKEMKADGTYDAIVSNTYRTDSSKKVLHISSYGPEDIWDIELQTALLSVFDQKSDVMYYGVSLNSLRYASKADMLKNALSDTRTVTMDRLPDLVIVSDNAALQFVLEYGHHLFADTLVLYCGITALDEYFITLAENHIYGLREYVAMLDNILLIEKLYPEATEIFCVNDYNLTGRAVYLSLMRDMESYQGPIAITHNTSYNFTDLLDEISALPPDTPILLGTFSSSRNGSPETRQYINKKICEAANGPVFSSSSIGNGEVGGIRSSAALQGRVIAAMAVNILEGIPPEQLDYKTPDQFVVSEFDWGQLQKFNLKETSLPKGSAVINRPSDFRRDNPLAYYLTLVTTLLLLIVALLMTFAAMATRKQNKALRLAQQSLVSLSELQTAHKELSDSANRLEQQYEQKKLLADISAALIQPGDFDQQLQLSLASIGAAFQCDRVVVGRIQPDMKTLQPSHEWINPHARKRSSRVNTAIYEGRDELFKRVSSAPNGILCLNPAVLRELFGEDSGMGTSMMAAFGDEGVIEGVLEIGYQQPYQWTRNDELFIQLLSATIATHISRNEISEHLVKAKEAAEQANVAKSQFLSTMSHEIRTPLNGIIGLVQVLKKKDASPEIHQRLEQITVSSEHLLSIVNDVLDMAKIESGKVALTLAPFEVFMLMDEVALLICQRAEEAGLVFVCRFESLEGLLVLGDKLLLKQVLINLLANAVKFSKAQGKVSFTVLAKKSSQERQQEIYFEVADNGIGIDGEQLGRIFQPFEQSTKKAPIQYGGTGLGLAISKRLVGLMGGTIQVESQLDKGSKFYFTLTLPVSETTAVQPEAQALGNADFTGKRILIVEDLAINREIIVELLSGTGAQLDTAEDGRQAVDKYMADPEGYDVILMDMQMPVMNGLEATKIIRSMDAMRPSPVPIIALTANAFEEDVQACLQAGMMWHISKPVSYQQLIQGIGQFV